MALRTAIGLISQGWARHRNLFLKAGGRINRRTLETPRKIMPPSEDFQFDHLDLPQEHRNLIRHACGRGNRVYMASMDKGLSGSSVWQARWELPTGSLSKLHVFKIGKHRKLTQELANVTNVASVIEPNFPHMQLYTSSSDSGQDSMALLRQEFAGEAQGKTLSLRQYIQDSRRCPDARAAASMLDKLYMIRMQAWHPLPSGSETKKHSERQITIAGHLPRWMGKIKLETSAQDLGRNALDKSLSGRFGTSVSALADCVNRVANEMFVMRIGPVHGDLHAQNVNIDDAGNLFLIDFGDTGEYWRALDFLVMECALKFVVSPPHASLDDLLDLEEIVDRQWTTEAISDCSGLASRIYGLDLEKIAASVCSVRRSAKELEAIDNQEHYRMGLVCLTAALTSIESLINRVFLYHSLADQLRRLGRL